MNSEGYSGISPLPAASVPANYGPLSQRKELVALLTTLSDTFAVAIPVKLLPGDIPLIEVPPDKLYATAFHLRDKLGFALLSSISGADMNDHLEVVYHLRNIEQHWLMEMKVRVPASNDIDSVVACWAGANALERETYDLFGIIFGGHPDLRRILLDDEFVGFPLLKSFRQTPLAVHDRATTQVDPNLALAAGSQKGTGGHRAKAVELTQGPQERLHPGTPTLGNAQWHGRSFPTTTWKHQRDYIDEEDKPS